MKAKNTLFTLVFLVFFQTLYAQSGQLSNSPLYYNDGRVGIGTLVPNVTFHVPNGEVIIGGPSNMSAPQLNSSLIIYAKNSNINTFPLYVRRTNAQDLFWVRGDGNGYFRENLGIGTSSPRAKLELLVSPGTASFPSLNSRGDAFQIVNSNNNGFEFGNSRGFNSRRAWILSRHSDVESLGSYYSSLHLQPDVGDKSQYRGVAIGYPASMEIPLQTHLAVNGKVGIGTSNPNASFQVANGNVIIGGPSNMSAPQLNSSLVVYARNEDVATFPFYVGRTNGTDLLWVKDDGNGYLRENLGLGTSNPRAKLEIVVSPASSSFPGINVRGDAFQIVSSNNNGFEMGNSRGVNSRKAWIIARHNDVENYGIHYSSFHIQPDIGNKSQFRGVGIGYPASTELPLHTHLAVNGNVGIGTINPGNYQLAVKGKIRAEEVRVETGWADFVFEENYPLMDLEEVEKFIKINKHLPEIPSAEMVAENGIELGEMNKLLLQKIEELTLYLLAQDKEIKLLKSVILNQTTNEN